MDITTAKTAQSLLHKISRAKDDIRIIENIPVYDFCICKGEGYSSVKLSVSVAENVRSIILDFYNDIIKAAEEELEKL